MKTVTVSGLPELHRLLEKDARTRARVLRRAVRQTAQRAASLAKTRVPVAFGELRESVHAEITTSGAQTIADAPHAAPVEGGTRPHRVPLATLVAWVKLRAGQGLLTPRQIGRLPGTTTQAHAISIAGQMKAMEKDGALDVDAPVRIARAIQAKIARAGTRPHWYARESLPEIMLLLDREIRRALRAGERESG